MRFIHTSDWHLGRSFHGVGLLDAQVAYLDHLVDVVRQEGVDAVLVSGDIYDRALPTPETVAVLDEGLARLIDAGAQVVLTSGNHDSAIRLGFGSRLLERAGLHVRTRLADIGRPVLIEDVAVHPLPYLDPTLAADPLRATECTHAGVLRAAMTAVTADIQTRGRPAVVMAHAFVAGATSSDSERDIAVGGVAAVPAEVFAAADYAALGHLHRPQVLTQTARYSGSPIALSFSEAGHTKHSELVELTATSLRCSQIEAPVHRPLARLRGRLEDLMHDPQLAAHESAWCEITLTDPARPAGAMDRLRTRFPHTLVLSFDADLVSRTGHSYAARVKDRVELDICCDFLRHVRGDRAASQDERALLTQALEATGREHAAGQDEGQVAEGGVGAA